MWSANLSATDIGFSVCDSETAGSRQIRDKTLWIIDRRKNDINDWRNLTTKIIDINSTKISQILQLSKFHGKKRPIIVLKPHNNRLHQVKNQWDLCKYSVGRESAFSIVASTMSAVRVSHSVASGTQLAVTMLAQIAEVFYRPWWYFRSCSKYSVARESNASCSIGYSVGRCSVSAIVASTLSAVRVLHPTASGTLSAERVLHPVEEAFCRTSECVWKIYYFNFYNNLFYQFERNNKQVDLHRRLVF